jgi:hypothetical protein
MVSPPLNFVNPCGTIPLKGGEIMTRDAEKALIIIYCQYKKRIGYGTNEEDARYFEDAKLRSIDNFSNWNRSKLNLVVQQLKELGFISMNIFDDVRLLDTGIEFVEEKPKEYFGTFMDAVSGLASVVTALFSG